MEQQDNNPRRLQMQERMVKMRAMKQEKQQQAQAKQTAMQPPKIAQQFQQEIPQQEQFQQEQFQQQPEMQPPAITQEQMLAIQQEVQNIARLQDNGIHRLEALKLSQKGQDIFIDFGINLFEKIDLLNINLERIAMALEGTSELGNETQNTYEN